jgi:hypothetical protein
VEDGDLFELGTRALVLGAHTDDEFGCAGTIARMVKAGAEVHYACFSSCEDSVPEGFEREVLKDEVNAAVDCSGSRAIASTCMIFRVRYFQLNARCLAVPPDGVPGGIRGVELGVFSKVPGAIINPGVRIGRNCVIAVNSRRAATSTGRLTPRAGRCALASRLR